MENYYAQVLADLDSALGQLNEIATEASYNDPSVGIFASPATVQQAIEFYERLQSLRDDLAEAGK